jgi:hypothetical protein
MTGKLCFAVGLALLLGCVLGSNTPDAQEDDDIVGEIKKKQAEKSGGEKPEKPDVAHKKPAEKNAEADAVAPEGGVVLKGSRVILPSIPEGSWCSGAWNLLDEGATAEVAGLTISRDSKGVKLSGQFKDTKAARKRQAFKPSTFSVTVVDGVEKPVETVLKSRDLTKGVDVETAGPDLRGQLVIRIEESWRGVVWGVITGYEFRLASDAVTLVDADFDGKCSTGDRMIYGERNLWMPFHTVTTSGRTIYHELAIGNSTSLVAKTTKMDDPGDNAGIWDKWQEVRKDHGVPPGIFSAKLHADCVKHANYCQANDYRGHEENKSSPGYTPEGHAAGMSSCIHFLGAGKEEQEMWDFMCSLYHRMQLLDPSNVTLQLGGNAYAFLMGANEDPSQPAESRSGVEAQLHPAPGSSVPFGEYRSENPVHPILSSTKKPGLPVIVRVPTYDPTFTDTDCRLYAVQGDLETGKRGGEIRCHLCHADKDAPAGFPTMWSMIALTPYEVLKAGTYEASFKFTEGGNGQAYVWRFTIGR